MLAFGVSMLDLRFADAEESGALLFCRGKLRGVENSRSVPAVSSPCRLYHFLKRYPVKSRLRQYRSEASMIASVISLMFCVAGISINTV